jgi:hypothetical protein
MTCSLLFPNGGSGLNPNILYRTNDERGEAEGEEDDEEDPSKGNRVVKLQQRGLRITN